MNNAVSYYKGLCAEILVAEYYKTAGYHLKEHRYKTPHGEIDLILERNTEQIFVEVKSSQTHAQAAARLSDTQKNRIFAAAESYLSEVNLYDCVNCRFDAALVDARGQIKIVSNAFL